MLPAQYRLEEIPRSEKDSVSWACACSLEDGCPSPDFLLLGEAGLATCQPIPETSDGS